MNGIEEKLRHALDEREHSHSLRRLPVPSSGTPENVLVDFCSNDYLGFSRSEMLRERIRQAEKEFSDAGVGSTGSRLISGNSRFCEELEDRIAKFHHAKAGLIFNSGYDANLGIFSSIPQRTDTILFDQLAHASIRDGIRLSFAHAFPFKHNDVEDFKKRLEMATGNIFVAVESIYSMDGDAAPLIEISELCVRHGANLIVDEAHATGIFGEKGAGKVIGLGLEDVTFARLYTFGKALGSHGAIVIGSPTLRSYLINYARSFIYTTALPFHSLLSIKCAYNLLESNSDELVELKNRILYFKEKINPDLRRQMIESDSAIQCVIIPGNENVKSVAQEIQQAGFDVRPILHPTVPRGSERIRICLHAFNTEEEIDGMVKTFEFSKTKILT